MIGRIICDVKIVYKNPLGLANQLRRVLILEPVLTSYERREFDYY